MSGNSGTKASNVSKSSTRRIERFDCVLLPAPPNLKRKRPTIIDASSKVERVLRPRTASTAEMSFKERMSSRGNEAETLTNSTLIPSRTSPARASSGEIPPPAPEQARVHERTGLELLSILDRFGNGDAERISVVESAPADTTSEEEMHGFQMLDPQECAMSSWTNVSVTQRSLYVPPGFSHLLQNMRHTLETERKARLKAEERLLTVIFESAEDEKKRIFAERMVEALEQDKLRLEQEKEALIGTATAMVAYAHRPITDGNPPRHASREKPAKSASTLHNAQFLRPSSSFVGEREVDTMASQSDAMSNCSANEVEELTTGKLARDGPSL